MIRKEIISHKKWDISKKIPEILTKLLEFLRM